MLLQAGVQFSFAAVLSVGVLWPVMKKILTGNMESGLPLKCGRGRWLLQQIGPSLAATIGTMPLTAYYYGEIPLLSLFLNMAVLPLMGLLAPIGLAAGLLGMVFPPAAIFLAGSLHYMLWLNNSLCRLASALPLAVWRTGSTPPGLMAVYYGAVILFLILAAGWGRRRSMVLLAVCLIIFVPVRRLQPMVVFLDIGQGDCIFIRSPAGNTWLVDGGSTDVSQVGKYRIAPFLDYFGEAMVDYVCISHGDADHITGIRELLEMSRIRYLLLTEVSRQDEACRELAELAGEMGTEVIYIKADDRWQDGGWQFTCLYPDDGAAHKSRNDQSMVLRLDAGAVSFLLTGDISEKVEQELSEADLADVDVLKVAHHGSGGSSSAEFLEEAGAEIAVISCGYDNRYGHPAEETLERLHAAGLRIYQTMRDGAVLMPCRNGRFTVDTWIDSCHD